MKYVLPAGVLLMAVPVWLSGAPLLVPLVIVGVAIFVAVPMFLVAHLSREHRKGSK